jgi:hypothetical protein
MVHFMERSTIYYLKHKGCVNYGFYLASLRFSEQHAFSVMAYLSIASRCPM